MEVRTWPLYVPQANMELEPIDAAVGFGGMMKQNNSRFSNSRKEWRGGEGRRRAWGRGGGVVGCFYR
jgi:hypothetical protein